MVSTTANESQIKPLSIDLIRIDGGTQARAALDEEVIVEYAGKMMSGVEFAPIDVFHDGEHHWVADGFHRLEGARKAKRGSIKSLIHNGTVRDAVLFAAGANATHGVRRTNADKRKAVETLLRDPEWSRWSDRKIAEHVGVGADIVGAVRRQLSENDSSSASVAPTVQTRVGRDGKHRKSPSPKAVTAYKSTRDMSAEERTAAMPKKFREAYDLYGRLVQILDQLNQIAPYHEHEAIEISLNMSYSNFMKWKRSATGSQFTQGEPS